MKQPFKIACLGVLGFGLVQGISYGAVYTYDWEGGLPGYSGTLVLDAPSSAAAPYGGSLSDVVSLVVTTPVNGTFVADVNPADGLGSIGTYSDNGNGPLVDTTLIWNPSQITQMVLAYYGSNDPNSPDYYQGIVVSETLVNGSLQGQLSFYNPPSPNVDLDITGQWVAAPAPEPAAYGALAGAGLLLVTLGSQFRRKQA
jgi:hypothetical protein